MAKLIEGDGPFYGPEDCQPYTVCEHGAPERADMLPKTICIRGASGERVWFERKSTVDVLLKQMQGRARRKRDGE